MKSPKQETEALLEILPHDISYETIVAEILFKMQLLERIEAVERGETMGHEEAIRRLSKWLKPNGQ